MKKTILLSFSILFFSAVRSQGNQPDSTKKDSFQITRELNIHQQEIKLDSLIKLQLESELSRLSVNNDKQKKELQQKLRRIIVKDSMHNAEQKMRIEQLKATAKGYPVLLQNDSLFSIYLRLGSFSPAERAAAITERIRKLYEDDFFNADRLKVLQNENDFDIVYNNDWVILSVTELDALFNGKTQNELATEYLKIIRSGISEYRQSNSMVNLLKHVGYATLVILGIMIVIVGISRVFKLLVRKLISDQATRFKGFRFQKFELVNARAHLQFTLKIMGVLKVIAILFALYLSLPLLFYIFPQTKSYTQTLLQWIINPAKTVVNGLFNYLPNLFTILVIYLFTRYAIKGVRFLTEEVKKGNLAIKGFYNDWAQPTFNIVRFLLYAFMIIVIFPYLPGSGSPAFQGVSVFLGILFSLGSSSAISNMVAGLVITYMRPFKVGDRVKIGDITGDILEKTMLVTRIRTIKNEEITVPNAMVLSSHTTNFTSGAENSGLIIHTSVTMGYDVPWQKIHQILIDAANRTLLIDKNPPPFVLQTSLEDFYVTYQINAYTREPSSLSKIHSDLHQHIQDCFNEADILILSPHYHVVRNDNMTTTPEGYLTKDYEAASFKVSEK
jgi:small-conductance mechanosensitive channel